MKLSTGINGSQMTLESFFVPSGIAVIGASADPVKLGYAVARNLVQIGYPGTLH